MLDQFYTNFNVANYCWFYLNATLGQYENPDDLSFLEPSAGSGVFLNLMPVAKRTGIDLDPRNDEIIKADFLKLNPVLNSKKHLTKIHVNTALGSLLIPDNKTSIVTVGNPPFGKSGALAAQFINHAAKFSSYIAFILPASFQKYTYHRYLRPNLKLLSNLTLGYNKFNSPDGNKVYEYNTVFQIWHTTSLNINLRKLKSPPIEHPDFKLYQYNNTVAVLDLFTLDFDFAVPCQGYQDYNRREYESDNCDKNKQWILIKAKTPEILANLKSLDYERLAYKYALTTPGFRKADLIEEYDLYYPPVTNEFY